MKERMKARAPQEEKAKDTVLINGIGFVAACVSRRNSAGSDSDTRWHEAHRQQLLLPGGFRDFANPCNERPCSPGSTASTLAERSFDRRTLPFEIGGPKVSSKLCLLHTKVSMHEFLPAHSPA